MGLSCLLPLLYGSARQELINAVDRYQAAQEGGPR